MIFLRYFILLFNLGCILFDSSYAECMEFIGEKRQREGVMAKFYPITADGCVEVCEHIDSCYAVNYFRLNTTCQLLNQTMPESKLIKATKCMYKAVKIPPSESINNDPCYKKLCPWDEICMHNKTTNSAECYPFCKTPPVKPGAINETVEVEVGQNYTYRCPEGVFGKSDQSPTVTCQQDGHWTSTMFACVCKTPPVKPGAITETVEVEVGQNYTYRCPEGVFGKSDQSPIVTCQQDGNWTSTMFACVCKTPPEIPGTIKQTAEVVVGQNYTYLCQARLFGKKYQNPTVTCLPDGTWTTTNFSCVCTAPPLISGTITEIVEVTVGQIYTYSCQSGLFLKGDPIQTCLYDGSWTSRKFICANNNWYPDTIYPNNIRKSNVFGQMIGSDLLACMQLCDNNPTCMSFFYYSGYCLLSSSFRRGVPNDSLFVESLTYYTAPLTTCDSRYGSVSFGGTMRCIKVYKINKVYDEAMTICESEKAKLLVISTMQEIADLKALISSGWTYAGIALESQGVDWVDWKGQPFYPFWYPGEPSNPPGPNCGYATSDRSGLIDEVCSNGGQFVCSKN